MSGIVWYSQLKMAEAAAASSAVGEFDSVSEFFFEVLERVKKKKLTLAPVLQNFSTSKKKTGSGGSETARERERGAETIPLTNKPPASPKTVGLVGVGKDARA